METQLNCNCFDYKISCRIGSFSILLSCMENDIAQSRAEKYSYDNESIASQPTLIPISKAMLPLPATLITEDLHLKVNPDEVFVVSDEFVKHATPHSGGQLCLALFASLAARSNPDTSRHEIIIRLKTTVSAHRFSGVYTGEREIVLMTYPTKVKEVEIESLDAYDQFFEFAEADAGNSKKFELNHPAFKPKLNGRNRHKVPVQHLFYDGSRTLKIQLRSSIILKATSKY